MRDFGVLEQDVIITDFAEACRQAGFEEVRIKTLAYAVPSFDLTPREWQAWTRLADSKRPARALRTIVRGVLEMLGVGKRGVLFEETFGMSLLRVLRHAMEDHPIILASKKVRSSETRTTARYRAAIQVTAGERTESAPRIPIHATVTNQGTATWRTSRPTDTGQVSLGVQLLDREGRLLNRDHQRALLPPHDVAPGASVDVTFDCPVPEPAGEYLLKFDMVAEGVTWFEPAGSRATVHRVGP